MLCQTNQSGIPKKRPVVPQTNAWVLNKTVEKTTATAISRLAVNSEWTDAGCAEAVSSSWGSAVLEIGTVMAQVGGRAAQ
jgi:hypothetical protein